VEKINQIRILSLWIFILPIVALNVCLFISINFDLFENTIFTVDQIGRTGFTIPYIDGSVSISRTARTFPAYLVFKPCMIITAVFLIKYWISTNVLVQNISSEPGNKKRFMMFGVLSAICLIMHSIFLGVSFEHDLYKFFRRFVLLAFIIFEIVAQALLVITLFKIKETISRIINKKILIFKILLVVILTFTALASLPILTSSGYVHFKHALEWNYFVGVVLFYLLTFFFWKKP
tara:strand:- start:170 stop:871 length:702 start_codon:yes stop_codon:yes gene_type:complete